MAELLKHRLGQAAVEQIATVLTQINPQFARSAFVQACLYSLESQELKQRVNHVIAVLGRYLPTDFTQAARILQQIPHHWQASTAAGDYGFAAWPLIDYVGLYGLGQPELALQTLERLTPLFTAEYAIRPFLQHHFDLSYAYLQRWTCHENPHVRRLASEGCRPRLPWGSRVPLLMQQPERIFPILDALKDDNSDYVQRSVANNLNDISKDHPEQVLAWGQQWLADKPSAQRQWIIKHATRGLVKASHADVVRLLGYDPLAELQQVQLSLDTQVVAMNGSISLSLRFYLPMACKLVIDYALHLPRANGKTSVKVFKWQAGEWAAGEHHLTREYTFKPLTTRRYYAGDHAFDVLANGQSVAKARFRLRL